MELRYRTSTINFCLDLTDPNSETVPVAVFVAADVPGEGRRLAALATRMRHPLRARLDLYSQELLDALPDLLQREVTEVFEDYRSASLRDLFKHICESFRNTLFISHVSDEAVVQDATSPWAELNRVLGEQIFAANNKIEAGVSPRWDPLESTCRHASLSIL